MHESNLPPLRNLNDNLAHEFARRFPILASHAGDPEPLLGSASSQRFAGTRSSTAPDHGGHGGASIGSGAQRSSATTPHFPRWSPALPPGQIAGNGRIHLPVLHRVIHETIKQKD